MQTRGKLLYDDYVEYEPGALDALNEYLNTPSNERISGSAEPGLPSTGAIPLSSVSNSSQKPTSSSLADNSRSRGVNGDARNTSITTDVEQAEDQSPLFLCLCADKPRHKVYLDQKPINNVVNDQQVFSALRQHYHKQTKWRWRSFFSIRAVRTIQFTKVGLSHFCSSTIWVLTC